MLNLAPALALAPDALRAVDLLLVNEHEAMSLGEGDARALHRALGVGVVRTLGERGAEFATADGAGHVPAWPVQAVDTTAAGDCFAGVLAAALERDQKLPGALRRASAAAALACTRPGAQVSLPRTAQIDALLAGTPTPRPH